MLGDTIHLALREAVSHGDIISPRIFTASPSLNGNSVQSVEAADSLVRKYKEDGYDFLKIHPGIKRVVFDQIVNTAREVGIPFSGHVPVDVGIRHALESQYASIDHLDGFLEGLVPETADVNPEENGFFGYNFTNLANTSMIGDLVEKARINKVWIVPTQSLFERWFAPVSTKDLIMQKEMQYMPGSTLRNWVSIKNQTLGNAQFDSTQWVKFDQIRKMLIKDLSENGHGILMGSDAPQLFNVPGFSIHHEIDGMQRAGMSNLEIIRTGTVNPAKFFGMDKVFGKVKKGMDADLIITHENPLEELDALQNLYGVFRMGKWLPNQFIQEELDKIAKRAIGN
jgi:imidazolonepropionase-like amidohydrolase